MLSYVPCSCQMSIEHPQTMANTTPTWIVFALYDTDLAKLMAQLHSIIHILHATQRPM